MYFVKLSTALPATLVCTHNIIVPLNSVLLFIIYLSLKSPIKDRMVEKVGPRREDIVVHLIDCHPELKKGIGFVRTGWQVAVNAATREGACSWRQPKTKYRGSIITTMERSELRDKVDNAKRENTITQNAAEDVGKHPLGYIYYVPLMHAYICVFHSFPVS
jgi:hypothetical protein